MEADILPMLVAGGKASVSECQGYFLDIGLPETLALAREELAAKLRRKAVFFDRDNTLVRDDGYTHKVEDLKWLPGAPEAIKAANDMGRAVIVITNQAGIARGLYKVEDMRAFHDAMQRELRAVGAHIDGFYFCPHHPDGVVAGLGKACSCRKPETGMLDQAFSELALEKEGSVFIGDKDTDIACGSRYGLASHHYKGGSLLAFCQKAGVFAA
jgi:D-glycero-D-manno-heptose 1,7-bisphosphate phosphatase